MIMKFPRPKFHKEEEYRGRHHAEGDRKPGFTLNDRFITFALLGKIKRTGKTLAILTDLQKKDSPSPRWPSSPLDRGNPMEDTLIIPPP